MNTALWIIAVSVILTMQARAVAPAGTPPPPPLT